MGADVAIRLHEDKIERLAKDVDVVLDAVGGDTLKRSYGVVKKGGIIVSITDDPEKAALDAHGIRGISIRTDPKASTLEELTRLIDAKKVKPVVSQTSPNQV